MARRRIVSTDDALYRHEPPFYGADGLKLWFRAPGRVVLAAALAVVPVTVCLWLLWQPFGWFVLAPLGIDGVKGVLLHYGVTLTAGVILTVRAAVWVGERTSKAEPVKHHKQVFITEMNTPRPAPVETRRGGVPDGYFLADRDAVTHRGAVPDRYFLTDRVKRTSG